MVAPCSRGNLRQLGRTVGLEVVKFARKDTLPFLAVVVVLGAVLWFLFPRATRMLERSYFPRLRKGDKEKPGVHAVGDADERRDGERDG